MRNVFWIAIVLIGFASCQKKELTLQEMLLGNWSVSDTTHKSWESDVRGFEFFPDSVCYNKLGYLDWKRYFGDTVPDRNDKILYSLGTKTKYAFSTDSLKIFNLTDKKWDCFGVKKITQDTLVLNKDTVLLTFVKNHYNTSKIPDFDAIIFSSSPCLGACPANNLIIYNNGNITYKGIAYVTKKGWYTSKIPKADFIAIQERFKRADYLNLKNNYSVMATDGQSISVSFLKNGRIIKTIDDYSNSGPKELIWAYMPLLTLEQNLKMKPFGIDKNLERNYFYSALVTTDVKKSMDMAKAELFYLITLLIKAPAVDIKFDEKFILRYDTEILKEVRTDGRYYKLYFKDGKTKIKDIGFNFITENKLKNKLDTIKN